MLTKSLIRALVGIEKIIAEEVFMEAKTNAIIIKSRLPKRDRYRCGLCNRKSPKYDKGQGARRWRWLSNVGVITAYIEPGSPWENGYWESYNARMRDEFLNRELFGNLYEAQVLTRHWIGILQYGQTTQQFRRQAARATGDRLYCLMDPGFY